jgi:hypothetical protein
MKKKTLFYSILLGLSLLTFILEVFIFQKPDGLLGFLIALLCLYMMIGCIIRLSKSSEKFKETGNSIIEIMFWLP